MHIGILQFTIQIQHSESLKDKRRVVKSLKDRTRRRFNVSIAEVDDLDDRHVATLGVAMAGADARYINGALDRLLESLDRLREAELVDHSLEIL